MEHIEYGDKHCVFCRPEQIKSKIKYILGCMVFEPLNPVVPGHILVVPEAHVSDFADDPLVTAHAAHAAAVVAREKGGDFNLITSKGNAATQTVMHMHIHLVPRSVGDGLKLPWSE